MQDVKLISAGTSDIPLISALAERIWNQHYPAIISQVQIDYMLELMYDHKRLKEQMTVKNHQFYFITAQSERIGFLSVHEEEDSVWQLNKFYIDQTKSRKGIGSIAFKELQDLTSASKIRLTVNRQNFKAINFYFKCGFKIERVADFEIGNGFVMNDFVMVWENRNENKF